MIRIAQTKALKPTKPAKKAKIDPVPPLQEGPPAEAELTTAQKWRRNNADVYKTYMRDYMRKRRLSAKEGK